MTGEDVVLEARKFLGVPWKHQGRDERGVDCAGLVLKVAHGLGLSTFDTADYLRTSSDQTMLRLCRDHLIEVSLFKTGDIPVIKYDNSRHIGFFGDYPGGSLSLIHAYSRRPRKVVEHRFTDDWMKSQGCSLLSVFRFPGVA